MPERRSNYTGSQNDIADVKHAFRNGKPNETPMMMINDITRLSHRKVEDGAPAQFAQNSNRFILRELALHTGLCQLELSRLTHLKPPTVSVALQKMEAEGLVKRVVDNVDKRTTRVFLTELGEKINEQLLERIREVDASALDGFSDEELGVLSGYLERIRRNLTNSKTDKER